MENRKRTTRQRTTGPQTTGPRTTGPRQGKTEKLKPASARAAAGHRAVATPNNVKRGAFDRMKKIFGLLQDGKYPNGTSLSTDFEVSLKTAGRDIEFMRDRYGLPIGYDVQRYGYYFTEPVDQFPVAAR